MIKLKDLLKETITQGGVVSRNPWIKEQDDTPKINVKELVSQINNFSKLGEAISGKDSLKGIAETLSSIAEGAAQHTLSETDDMFDKVTVSRNMKELTNHSRAFSKIAEEASSVQQRLAGLYEDMGNILNRYYDIPEGEEKEKEESDDTIKEGDYEAFFQSAMKKYGIKSPDELESDEKKKEFFNYVDKNYKAKSEGKFNEGGPGSGRPSDDDSHEPDDLSDFDPTHDR